jgi:hypothetical protein
MFYRKKSDLLRGLGYGWKSYNVFDRLLERGDVLEVDVNWVKHYLLRSDLLSLFDEYIMQKIRTNLPKKKVGG